MHEWDGAAWTVHRTGTPPESRTDSDDAVPILYEPAPPDPRRGRPPWWVFAVTALVGLAVGFIVFPNVSSMDAAPAPHPCSATAKTFLEALQHDSLPDLTAEEAEGERWLDG